jgi:hypothetical protein
MLKLAPGQSNVLDFGAVVPGTAEDTVMFVASAAASVTARIEGGGGHFHIVSVVSQSVTEQMLTPEEIAQLPPKLQKDPRFHVSVERRVVGSSDGVVPLAVEAGHEITFRAAFQGVDREGDGVLSATLVISEAGRSISVPMSALVGQVQAEVPAATVSVTQGEAAVVSVTVRSRFGPDTAVLLEMDEHSGIAMSPVFVPVERGGRVQASVRLEAERFAQAIQVRKELRMTAFDGRQTTVLPVSCQILPAPPPISQSPAHSQPIRPDWWQWRNANPRNAMWKDDYVVTGALTNKGGSDLQDVSITLFEVFVDPANLVHEANLGSTEHHAVAPSRSALGSIPPLKKDWQWFIPGVWVVKGPLHREFRYRALISAKDVNGIPYPPVTSADLRIIVNVSKLKRTSGAFSMGAAAAAAGMLASFILAVAGAAAYAAAAAAGAVAVDPPEPDPNFLTRIPLPPLGDVPASGPDRTVALFYRLGERVMQIELTKSLIEGRRLGALAAGDTASVEMHRKDLVAATALQRQLVNEASALEGQAKVDIAAAVPPGTDLRQERQELKAAGVTSELAKRAQIPAEHRAGLDELLRSDLVRDLDIARTLDTSIVSLTDFAESLD